MWASWLCCAVCAKWLGLDGGVSGLTLMLFCSSVVQFNCRSRLRRASVCVRIYWLVGDMLWTLGLGWAWAAVVYCRLSKADTRPNYSRLLTL